MSKIDEWITAATDGDHVRLQALLMADPSLLNQKDASGASAIHYAVFHGQREVAQWLARQGADVNSRDNEFGATPAGWAIEYLRELGGFLAIELEDFAYAIDQGDKRWVARFLLRFPALREGKDRHGVPFRELARLAGDQGILELFEAKLE